MKLIAKTLLFFSLTGISLSTEAKQIELLFNQTVQEELHLNSLIDDNGLECPTGEQPQLYCKQVTIENVGSDTLQGCLPFVGQTHIYTLETLADQIAEENHPVEALYHLWIQHVSTNSEELDTDIDPLYILNFKGQCSKADYAKNFMKLCSLLGFDVRAVQMHGREGYDVCYAGEWEFFDPTAKQIYYALNNQTLVSSEEMMDDPFLVIRTKAERRTSSMDIKQSWQQVAQLPITTPYLADELSPLPSQDALRPEGFSLYPQEKLIYYAQAATALVEHVINLETREAQAVLNYHSPFPIQEIYNGTSSPLNITGRDEAILPGERLSLSDANLFLLEIQAQALGSIHVYSACSKHAFPTLSRGQNDIHLGSAANNASSIKVSYEIDEELETRLMPAVNVVNQSIEFDHRAPFFRLEAIGESPIDAIWWQISSEPDFALLPSNFDQVEPFSSTVNLPAITETFFNADDYYYFRVKALINGQWCEWSEPFVFVVRKPDPIYTYEFSKLSDNQYEISWEGDEDEDIEYLIFGSNSLDFVPSIYCDTQLNAAIDGEIIQEEANNNLQAVIRETKYIVDGSLAYYRILVRRHGQVSVPSPLIHVYDSELVQTRDVLQQEEDEEGRVLVRRVEIPRSYLWLDSAELFPRIQAKQRSIFDVSAILSKKAFAANVDCYSQSPHVNPSVWAYVKPYFLPENHPMKPRLDRLFSEKRVTLNSTTFKEAGFKRNRIGRFSRVMASAHPHMQGIFVKAFADTELYITADWQKWIHRIEGARAIQACIDRHNWQHQFKVPLKWIYPLPPEPSPPNSNKYLRKNFILIAEDMRIYEHDKNEKYYKKKMNKQLIGQLYTILEEEGLYDSVYAFNVPFCKDGRLAFIDTEYHHRWPVPYHKFKKYFSKDMQKYWDKITKEGLPK